MACSSESEEGICQGQDWTCTPENVARTCSTFPPRGKCGPITKYPNATIKEYGSISGATAMAKEIYARGPISCGIDAGPILEYTGGIVSEPGDGVDHVHARGDPSEQGVHPVELGRILLDDEELAVGGARPLLVGEPDGAPGEGHVAELVGEIRHAAAAVVPGVGLAGAGRAALDHEGKVALFEVTVKISVRCHALKPWLRLG